jgi:hypothetical protein
MPKLEYPDPDTPITAEWGRALVDTINLLLRGPEVCPPLAKIEGTLFLGQDYQLYEAITADVIAARSGSTWTSGPASFRTVSAAGAESTMYGTAAFTAWNWSNAEVPSGTRIWVCWSYDKWAIMNADCPGS